MKTKYLLAILPIFFIVVGCDKQQSELTSAGGKDAASIEKSFKDADIENMTISDLKKPANTNKESPENEDY